MTKCHLCGEKKTLQQSHIIPKFFISWLKDSSATGYMRSTPTPSRRSQDGPKSDMLCGDCEEMFGQWETLVASNIFHPFNQHRLRSLSYGPWLLKFAASVSWRSLSYYLEMSRGSVAYSQSALDIMGKALQTWKYLWGRWFLECIGGRD
jgi:hypothetical protein